MFKICASTFTFLSKFGSNWFRLHQKVLALIYYIRKLFTPLKNPAFTARVHFSPISTEIQIRQSREKYILSAASIENFY